MNKSTWQVAQCENAEYIIKIANFLLPEYSRIFGYEVMFATPCVIFNSPNSDSPIFIHETQPLAILLTQQELSYWAQTIYQLSHEMCHYAMYQTKQDKSRILSWFEEIVCEAMSLYALHYAAENWHNCQLSSINAKFGKSIQGYLDHQLARIPLDEFSQCNTPVKLMGYEKSNQPENNRATHLAERNRVYHEILKNPLEASCFLHYTQYIDPSNDLLIDFETWLRDEPCNLVHQLYNIYPIHTH